MKIQAKIILVSVLCTTMMGLTVRDLFSVQKVKVRIVKEDAVLRLQPDNDSQIIRELDLGAEFEVSETIAEWLKVMLPPTKDGIIVSGYVHKSFVELASISTQPEIPKEPVQPKQELILSESPDRSEDAYNQWKRDYERAKARQRAGNSLEWTGLLGGLVNGFLYVTDKEEISYGYGITEEKGKPLYLIGAGAGFLFMVVGAMIAEPAKGEVKLLEEEGARLGYFTAGLTAIHGGYAISFKICF